MEENVKLLGTLALLWGSFVTLALVGVCVYLGRMLDRLETMRQALHHMYQGTLTAFGHANDGLRDAGSSLESAAKMFSTLRAWYESSRSGKYQGDRRPRRRRRPRKEDSQGPQRKIVTDTVGRPDAVRTRDQTGSPGNRRG